MALTTAELSEVSGLDPQTILAMRRDGVLQAEFVNGRYLFGEQEVELVISLIDACNDNMEGDELEDETEEDLYEESDLDLEEDEESEEE